MPDPLSTLVVAGAAGGNQALYTRTPPVYDKNMMQHVTSIAGVGNDCAHNDPKLVREDVERLMNGLRDFLVRFST
jgi:hypothetical protein